MERLAYGIAEAARALGVSRVTLYRRIWAGEIKAIKLGGRTLIPAAELQRLLAGAHPQTPSRMDGTRR